MLFASTTISNGSCVAVVTSTGMATEIGAIQELNGMGTSGWVGLNLLSLFQEKEKRIEKEWF